MKKKSLAISCYEDIYKALDHLHKAKDLIKTYSYEPDGDIAVDVWQDYLRAQMFSIDYVSDNLRDLVETYKDVIKDFDGDENGIEE